MRKTNGPRSEKSAAYYAANADRQRAWQRAYYAANADKVKAAHSARAEAHPERIQATNAANYAANAETRRAAKRQYRVEKADKIAADRARIAAAYPERHAATVKACSNARRARVRGAISDLSSSATRAIHDAANGTCAYCLVACPDLHLEHCIPLARGGTHTADNVVMACPKCNRRKGTKTPLEFLLGVR